MADLVVDTKYGKVSGEQHFEVAIWKGIPYGAPPVGEQRFRPPAPPVPWTGVRDGTRFGPASIQSRDPRIAVVSGVSAKFATSEDCLVLNVYAPAGATGRPVVLWIHGGAFVMGSGSTPIYNGTAFAERGVVAVTINYRLGLPGLLYLGDLAPDRADGNPMLLDMVAALTWVRDNIAGFGGDPGMVTVMGESAGAIAIGHLLAMPAARGLFHRAILESGAPPLFPLQRAEVTALARSVLDELGVSVDGLMHLPIERVLEAQENRSQNGGLGMFSPYIDGVTVPRLPIDAVRAGEVAGIPLMLGTNRDEWTLFEVLLGEVTVEPFKPLLREQLGPQLDRMLEVYRDNNPRRTEQRAWIDIIGDLVFRIPAIRTAEAQASHGTPVYMYRFDWESPQFGGRLGATHALELIFVWNRLDLPTAPMLLGPDPLAVQALATAMHEAWVAFITTGDPNGNGRLAWPRYDAERRSTMLINRAWSVADDPGAATRALWTGL